MSSSCYVRCCGDWLEGLRLPLRPSSQQELCSSYTQCAHIYAYVDPCMLRLDRPYICMKLPCHRRRNCGCVAVFVRISSIRRTMCMPMPMTVAITAGLETGRNVHVRADVAIHRCRMLILVHVFVVKMAPARSNELASVRVTYRMHVYTLPMAGATSSRCPPARCAHSTDVHVDGMTT